MDTYETTLPRDRESYEARVRQRQAELRTELAEILAAKPPEAPLVLEIGAGHGHFLTSYANEHPHDWCLGIDIMSDRVRRAQKKRTRAGHPHLHFLRCEAREFLECLPDGVQFDRIFVLFPDPWPKKRHHKNRLLTESFFSAMAPCSAPGAKLSFRTDHQLYFDQVEETVRAHPCWRLQSPMEWLFEESTVFQQRAETYFSLVAIYDPTDPARPTFS